MFFKIIKKILIICPFAVIFFEKFFETGKEEWFRYFQLN